jgi:hypothetical protein
MYEARGWNKHYEQDIFDDGCQPNTGGYAEGKDTFEAGDIHVLISKLMRFVGTDDKKDVLINACEEIGRIDIQNIENDEGYAASERELVEWKAGNVRLWSATYTFHVEKVERTAYSATPNGNEAYYNEITGGVRA